MEIEALYDEDSNVCGFICRGHVDRMPFLQSCLRNPLLPFATGPNFRLDQEHIRHERWVVVPYVQDPRTGRFKKSTQARYHRAEKHPHAFPVTVWEF